MNIFKAISNMLNRIQFHCLQQNCRQAKILVDVFPTVLASV